MKKYNTLFILILFVPVFLFSCKKDGEIIEVPSFGELLVKFTAPNSSDVLFFQVDGIVKDTASQISLLFLETGNRQISIVDAQHKKFLDTMVNIGLRKPVNLSCFYNGTNLFLDDLDPNLKPQTDSLLIRFINTDKTLPDLIDIQISLYDLNGILIPLPNKTVRGIRKDKFSNYIQLPNPNIFDPSFDTSNIFYVIEGFDATPGGDYKKIMSIADFNFSYIVYKDESTYNWLPNGILSLDIGSVPEDGSTSLRTPHVIFLREIN